MSPRLRYRCPAAFLVSTAALFAQGSQIRGPVQPYVFDAPTRSLRAINGMPGFSSLGPVSVDLPGSAFGSVSPSGKLAVACGAGETPCVLISTNSSAIQAELPGGPFAAEQAPDGAAWSSDSNRLVLYSRKSNRLRSYSGLNSTVPRLDIDLELPNLSSATFGPAGELLAATSKPDGAGVFRLSPETGPALLLDLPNPGSIAVSSKNGLFVYNRDTGRIEKYSMMTAGNGTIAAAARDEMWGFDQPLNSTVSLLAVKESRGREVLLVANSPGESEGAVLLGLDTSTAELLQTFNLAFQPNRLEPSGADNFLLFARSADGEPFWCLSLAQAEPKVYFIPAGSVATTGGQIQ